MASLCSWRAAASECIYAERNISAQSLYNQCRYWSGEQDTLRRQLDLARKSQAEVARRLPEIYRQQLEAQDDAFKNELKHQVALAGGSLEHTLRGAGKVEGGPVAYDDSSFVVREPSGRPTPSEHGIGAGDITENEKRQFEGMAKDFAELQVKWVEKELAYITSQMGACGCAASLRTGGKR